MRAVPVLALLCLPATAQAAIRPAQAEIVVADRQAPDNAKVDLDLKDGRRVAFHLACRGDGAALRCMLSRKGKVLASASLNPDAVLTGGPRETTCKAGGVSLTLSVSDLIQTRPDPIADSYHFRVAAAAGGKDAPPCPP